MDLMEKGEIWQMFNERSVSNIFFLAILFSFLISSSLLGGGSNNELSKIVVVPRIKEPPKIDGVLDDPAWAKAAKVTGFYKFKPVDGVPASERTLAYVAYDSDNLYFAFRCFDASPDKITAHYCPRDKIFTDDFVVIVLDTFNAKRRGYIFLINPYGIQGDGLIKAEGNDDMSFDTVFYSDGKVDEKGYTVEVAIPFRSLRFPPKFKNIGFAVARTIQRKSEQASCPPISINRASILDQLGELVGFSGVGYKRTLEFLPFITTSQAGNFNEDEGRFINGKVKPDFGIGVKYGISSNLTLDLTLNPDFSQVEADAGQVDVNLRYALYFEEKRPFFLEGKDIFTTPIEVVYTRRILDPLYGAKLTGKIGKTTIGFISALDEGPGEKVSGEENEYLGEKALFNIIRIKRDILRNSEIGAILTDREFAGSHNRVFGVDGKLFLGKKYLLFFQALGSHSRNLDGEDSSDPAFTFVFARSGRHLYTEFDYLDIYPNFNAEAGFIRRTDIRQLAGYLHYKFYPNRPWLLTVRPEIYVDRYYDHSGINVEENKRLGLSFELSRQTEISLRYIYRMERYAGIDFEGSLYSIIVSSQPTTYLTGFFSYSAGMGINYDEENPYLGHSRRISGSLNFRPSPLIQEELRFTRYTFYRSIGGETVYDVNIWRSKTVYQFTKKLFLRGIIEYNTYYNRVTTDLLLSYTYVPGTVFFIGYGGRYENSPDYPGTGFTELARRFFFKFSYLWRK